MADPIHEKTVLQDAHQNERHDEPMLDSVATHTSDEEIRDPTQAVDDLVQQLNDATILSEYSVQYNISSPEGDRSGVWQSLRLLCLESNTLVQSMASLYTLEIFMGYVAEEERNIPPLADSSSSSPLWWAGTSDHEIEKSHLFRPCHYFDYISGTGSGGMAATLLGVMRFSVPEAIDRMERVLHVATISGSRTDASPSTSRKMPPRSETELAQLKKVVREQIVIPNDPLQDMDRDKPNSGEPFVSDKAVLQADSRMCQTVCITAIVGRMGIVEPHVLKSFGEPPHSGTSSTDGPCNMPIADACLACVTPQLLCESVRIKSVTYTDAAILDVSSTWQTFQEASRHRVAKGIGYSLSIQCNRPGEAERVDTYRTRCDQALEKCFPGAFRVVDIQGDPDKDARKQAEEYCVTNKAVLREWAETLVKARRARARTQEWSRFAGLRIPQNTSPTDPGN